MFSSRELNLRRGSSVSTSAEGTCVGGTFNPGAGDGRILALAMDAASACLTAARARSRGVFEELLSGSDFPVAEARGGAVGQVTVRSAIERRSYPAGPSRLSSNIDACASYGCVGAGGD